METLLSHVDGEFLDGVSRWERENPSNLSETVSVASLGDRTTARRAIDSARAASGSWRTMPAPQRGEILRRCADAVERRSQDLATSMAREQGKTLPEAAGEVARTVAIFRYFSAQTLAPDGETFPSHGQGTRLYARRVPLGVVSVITPWNFPLAIPAWKIAPALAYGNTVVWKPSEVVPMTSSGLLHALIDAGLPAGVLNMVLGAGPDVGDTLTGSSVDAVSFTGSTSVGRDAVLPAAAASAIAVQLELGGKNVAVVLPDADLALAATQVARGAFLSAGQKCTATSLVLVAASIHEEFTDRLASLASAMRVGDPLDPQTDVGPLATAGQLERYNTFLDPDSHRGEVVTGGQGDKHGYFARPAVITNADMASRAACEEIFGPIAVLASFQTEADAVEMANGTPYGLTASIFTRDLAKAYRFADDIDTGIVKVNQESAGLEYHVPFGGTKASAYGPPEQGLAARDFYTKGKTIYMTHAPA